jgi:hypothetical protein
MASLPCGLLRYAASVGQRSHLQVKCILASYSSAFSGIVVSTRAA